MQATEQIIERNLHRREPVDRALWINPGRQAPWRGIGAHCHSLQLLCHDFQAYSGLNSEGAPVEFSAFPGVNEDPYQWIIIGLPRQRALLELLLDLAASCLASDGVVWLAGENKAGIKSSVNYLKHNFSQVRKLDSARHCALFEASGLSKTHEFDRDRYRQQWTMECANGELKVVTFPGVFASGRLDPGSALLLEAAQGIVLQGEVLDFGCGAGIVGACLSRQCDDLQVSYLDNNAMALEACRETLAANQLDGEIIASDGLRQVARAFDAIVSNPPIHDGVKTDNFLGMRLLDRANDCLKPGGLLLIVANIHLPYEAWLKSQFGHYEHVTADTRFKVLSARKPG
jgi:16S rRNA (guanine1207-N2)-methyltransferase